MPLVTIDGADARDFDDAVYCEPIAESGKKPGGFRLLVAIADVGHYVKTGDALDKEASERSTSVYFPRRVIPMLPERLSNGLCSINPSVDRLVLVCDMVITAAGELKAYQFFEAVMNSAARLTYDEVWGILSGRDMQAVKKRAALIPQLQNLYDLFQVFFKARKQRGAIDFDTTETQIVCDAAGRIERIVPRTRNDAHRLIEECMLAANVCAADFMKRSKHAGLYRIHEGPTPEKLKALREFLRTVGLSLGGSEHPKPADYAELSAVVRQRPDANLLQSMMLRSMQQAVYSPDNVGHFGLAYEAYAHFTSPIRRYPDLMTHRVIKSLLAGKRYQPAEPGTETDSRAQSRSAAMRSRGKVPAASKLPDATEMVRPQSAQAAAEHDRWQQIGLLCSGNERRADDATRDVEAWLKCQYMRERVGEQYAGRISGVAPFGVFVTLNDMYVDGLVHVSELGSEYFQYNEAALELRGERTGIRYRLTDELHIQVARVDLEARRIEFRLVPKNGLRAEVGASNGASAPGKVRAAAGKDRTSSGKVRASAGKPVLANLDQMQVARKLGRSPAHGAGKKRATAAAKPPRGTKAARRQKRK